MRIRVNRVTAGILLILSAPVVLPIKLYRWMTGTGKKPVYRNTIDGEPLNYAGDRPIVVSIWATWASVWSVATAGVIQQMQTEFAGKCEFVYVEATGRDVENKYEVKVIPAVLVFHRGQEVGRFINLMEPEELRSCLSQWTADGREVEHA